MLKVLFLIKTDERYYAAPIRKLNRFAGYRTGYGIILTKRLSHLIIGIATGGSFIACNKIEIRAAYLKSVGCLYFFIVRKSPIMPAEHCRVCRMN